MLHNAAKAGGRSSAPGCSSKKVPSRSSESMKTGNQIEVGMWGWNAIRSDFTPDWTVSQLRAVAVWGPAGAKTKEEDDGEELLKDWRERSMEVVIMGSMFWARRLEGEEISARKRDSAHSQWYDSARECWRWRFGLVE